jgi:hypothetical protein
MNERPSTGEVLCSPESEARFLVVDPGAAVNMPSIGELPLVPGARLPCSSNTHARVDRGLYGGRRYVDVVSGLRLLCIRPGRGPLCLEGRVLILEPERRNRVQPAANRG